MTILEAMRDPALFGPWFEQRASWRAWEVFLAALFGLPLVAEGATTLYARHTGRSALPAQPAREGWVIVGRRRAPIFSDRSRTISAWTARRLANCWKRKGE